MKKIIIIAMISCFLNASEDIPKATQLEMFLFKIGFTSLVDDFNNEKNITKLNTNDIKELQENVKYILSQQNNNKLQELTSKIVVHDDTTKLLSEIKILREEVNQLKSKYNVLKSVEEKEKVIVQEEQPIVQSIMTIRVKEVNVRKSPFPASEVVKTLYQGDKVDIEFCNKYGWCKLKDEKQYIAKFLLQGF